LDTGGIDSGAIRFGPIVQDVIVLS